MRFSQKNSGGKYSEQKIRMDGVNAAATPIGA